MVHRLEGDFDSARSRLNLAREIFDEIGAAWQLGRTLTLDTKKIEFVNDAEANRMRSRARRAPWHACS